MRFARKGGGRGKGGDAATSNDRFAFRGTEGREARLHRGMAIAFENRQPRDMNVRFAWPDTWQSKVSLGSTWPSEAHQNSSASTRPVHTPMQSLDQHVLQLTGAICAKGTDGQRARRNVVPGAQGIGRGLSLDELNPGLVQSLNKSQRVDRASSGTGESRQDYEKLATEAGRMGAQSVRRRRMTHARSMRARTAEQERLLTPAVALGVIGRARQHGDITTVLRTLRRFQTRERVVHAALCAICALVGDAAGGQRKALLSEMQQHGDALSRTVIETLGVERCTNSARVAAVWCQTVTAVCQKRVGGEEHPCLQPARQAMLRCPKVLRKVDLLGPPTEVSLVALRYALRPESSDVVYAAEAAYPNEESSGSRSDSVSFDFDVDDLIEQATGRDAEAPYDSSQHLLMERDKNCAAAALCRVMDEQALSAIVQRRACSTICALCACSDKVRHYLVSLGAPKMVRDAMQRFHDVPALLTNAHRALALLRK